MDLEDWELLPDEGFLQIHDDGGKKIFSRKFGGGSNNVFKSNYFICPSPTPHNITGAPESLRPPSQILPVPIQLGPSVINYEKVQDLNTAAVEADQDTVSQVFFKKMKENEFVEMKMDSPKASGRGFVPQIDTAGTFQFEGTSEAFKGEGMEGKTGPKKKKAEKEEEEKNGGLNIWKWGLTGIGAICSFGVAAATICIIILGNHHKTKHQQNQKLRFEIYKDEKRIKQVVHHATKLNEAISTVRGVPLTRAQITIGGYYDGL